MVDAVREATGLDYNQYPDAASLAAAMRAIGHQPEPNSSRGKLIDSLFSTHVEPKLIQPTFITDYPIEISPLAKKKADDPTTVERFEYFIGGLEMGNAFTELNDPIDQRERFVALRDAMAGADENAHPLDEDFLTALSFGMPPTGGFGTGIDRLTMLFTDKQSIREVILFPHLQDHHRLTPDRSASLGILKAWPMPEHPLYVALVWHMHQPFYRDMLTGGISLPWVRMHAAKDYLHMGQALAAYPKVHQTINLVPSLTEQMLAWANGEESDELARLAEQPGWTEDEKRIILNLGFSINWDNIIRRYPRYSELLDRRPAALADPNAFSTQDYLDLLAWFNLAWIDPNWLEGDPAAGRAGGQGPGLHARRLARDPRQAARDRRARSCRCTAGWPRPASSSSSPARTIIPFCRSWSTPAWPAGPVRVCRCPTCASRRRRTLPRSWRWRSRPTPPTSAPRHAGSGHRRARSRSRPCP